MKLSQYGYDFTPDMLAKYPAENRDEARLMVVNRATGQIEHRIFKDIIDYFEEKDVFVFNDTKVFPARLYGNKEKTGAEIEIFLLRELNRELRLWDVLVDPARKIRIGNKLYFGDDDMMGAEVIDNTTSRGRTLRFLFDGSYEEFKNTLFSLGETSIPVELFDDNADIARVVAPYLLGGVIGVDKTMAARFLLPIMDACGEVDFVVGSDCVDDVRAIKDEAEKQLMRRASEINDACMEKLAAFIHEGVTEKECAEYLDSCYAGYAVDGLSFPSNISFGANAADPHHRPDDTVIKCLSDFSVF